MVRRWWLGGALALAGALLPGRMVGQDAAGQQMLTAWQDSLDQVTTLEAIAPLDPLSRRGARGDLGDLRRQLFLIRSAELRAARPDFELALDNLNWISLRQRKWPWPDYLSARIFLAMSLARMPVTVSTGQLPHEAHSDAVWRLLGHAITLDSSFALGKQRLFQLMASGGERPLRPAQYAALRRELQRSAPHPDALLVWGRELRRQRQLPEALAAFERSAQLGGDGSRLDLERARTLRALGETQAAQSAYWSGLDRLSSIGRAEYRLDLAWLLPRDSLARFDRVPDDSLRSWLADFWDVRDAQGAHQSGARLLDQLYRWSYVFGRFSDIEPWKRTMYTRADNWFESGLSGPPCVPVTASFFTSLWKLPPTYPDDPRYREPIIDNRGLVYLRHGEPIRRYENGGRILPSDTALWFSGHDPYRDREVVAARALHPVSYSKETWLYFLDQSYRALEFRGYTMTGEGVNSLGGYAATTLASYLQYDPRQWLALAEYIPSYSLAARDLEAVPVWDRKMPGGGGDSRTCSAQFQAQLHRGRDDSRDMVAVESKSPPIVHPWANSVQAFALGRGTATGHALVAMALGGPALLPDSGAGEGSRYTIDFRIVARDAVTGRTVTVDTTRQFGARQPLRAGQSLTALFDLPLGPGQWQVAVRANKGVDSVGLYALVRDVTVPAEGGVSLSDIVPGLVGSPPWRATDGEPFPVNYFSGWKSGATAELYYEVHGLADGASYRTTIEVHATDRKVKQGVQLASTDRATGDLTSVRRSLGLERLPPGAYILTITVESAGQRASRSRPITILKP